LKNRLIVWLRNVEEGAEFFGRKAGWKEEKKNLSWKEMKACSIGNLP